MKNKDCVIAVLKIGKADFISGGEGITIREIKKCLLEQGYSEKSFKRLKWVLGQSFQITAVSGNDEDNIHLLTLTGYFQLLQYDDLNHARSSSKKSMWVAIISIIFASISLLLQL